MIVELAIGAGAVAVGLGGYRAWRARRARAGRRPPDSERPGGTLQVGDVLLMDDQELWLAGAIHLRGEPPVHLFAVPGAPRGAWVGELELPTGTEVALLESSDALPAGRVPDELRLDGIPLQARCRGRVDVTREGEALPPVTERAELTVLGGPGGRWLVAVGFVAGDRLVLAGNRLDWDRVDRLPGGH